MNLHCSTLGKGRPLILIHGWGMHGGVWNECAGELARHFRVLCPDLPGHGHSPAPRTPIGLTDLAGACLPLLEEKSLILGWSLGGLVALALARQAPERVAGLVLTGATPRFAAGEDWPHGMAPRMLEAFRTRLAEDAPRTLQRFLALQAQGDSAGRGLLRRLQTIAARAPAPDTTALASGLAILENSDLRPTLAGISCPVLVIHGETDALVPVAAAAHLADALPRASLQRFARSGHVPFLSRAGEFLRCLVEFAAHER